MHLTQMLLMAAVAAPAALAGCLTPEDVPEEWRDEVEAESSAWDAPPAREPQTIVVEGTVGGTRHEDKAFTVPDGVASLHIVATYSVGGSAHFTLLDPDGEVVKEDDIYGGSSHGAADWFVRESPESGDWRLEIDAIGGGSYRFEITY